MTKIAWIEDSPEFGWHVALAAIVAELGAQPDTEVTRAVEIATAPEADAYVLVSGQAATLMAAIENVAARAPQRLSRLLLIGAPLDFPKGFPLADAGTFAEAMERHQLAGVIGGGAVLQWREMPSDFAGPKALMAALGANELKALQTDHYAVWAKAPGRTMAAFLGRYVAALATRR